ncbi:MAG: hypothetical protein IJT27_06930 [Clostridia bacterium]|nr:hypothetical protein [Clostridia bacterium]
MRNDFYPERAFQRAFTLTKDDFSCKGTVTCSAYDDLTVAFSYPEGLSYFNVRVSAEQMSAEVGDMSDALLLEELPEDSPIKLMVNAIRTFVFTNVGFTRCEDGAYACAAELAGLRVDGFFTADGALRSVACEENGLYIEFD